MLGKLIKYEFKTVNRLMIPLHLGLIGITIIGRFYIQMALSRRADSIWTGFADASLMMFYIIALIAIALVTSIYLSIIRFRKNLFTDEGYLMHTLPVSVHEQIWGKLIVTTVWGTIDMVLILLSVLVMFLNQDMIAAIFDEVPTLFYSFRYDVGVSPVVAVLVWIPILLIAEMAAALIYYMCITIGHSFHTHKILYSVGIYVGVNIFSNVVTWILALIAGTSSGGFLFPGLSVMNLFLTNLDGAGMFWLSTGITLITALVQGGVCYLLTAYFMKNRLNLE